MDCQVVVFRFHFPVQDFEGSTYFHVDSATVVVVVLLRIIGGVKASATRSAPSTHNCKCDVRRCALTHVVETTGVVAKRVWVLLGKVKEERGEWVKSGRGSGGGGREGRLATNLPHQHCRRSTRRYTLFQCHRNRPCRKDHWRTRGCNRARILARRSCD